MDSESSGILYHYEIRHKMRLSCVRQMAAPFSIET